jgi:tetratricopeptide (TPR) repeat protein
MLIDAFRLTRHRSFSAAVAVLEGALNAGRHFMPTNMLFVARYWKGRAHRQQGDFEQAMVEIRSARELGESLQAGKLVAVAKIHESWLVFFKGDRRLAFQLLAEAEEVLGPSGHALSLGNIASARGRFVRSAGDYARALQFFEQAIGIYEHDYPTHPNLGRALVNAAYVKRLMALELRPQGQGRPASAATHAKTLEITSQAIDLLRRASAIYSQNPHEVGNAAVSVSMGHLLLEQGEIEQAGLEAAAACSLGEANLNNSLLARANILQTYVALAASEEEIETGDGESHARKAVQHAQEALSNAKSTQNRRLLASAHIARGLAAADPFYADWEIAKEHAAKADHLLGDEDRDHLFRELNGLKRKIMRSVRVDEVFRSWAAGELGGKTFQQTQEEFAEIVIPRVWNNVGRNISMVAHELRISPKKGPTRPKKCAVYIG